MRIQFLFSVVLLFVAGLTAGDSTTLAPTTTDTTQEIVTTVPTAKTKDTTTPEPITKLPITTTTTTTELPTTTTTVAPTTTSPPTTTTTEAPHTTTAEPTTTTDVPITTSNVPSTTKSPEPSAQEGSWNVTEGNTTCIRADLKIRFKIPLASDYSYIVLSPNASSAQSDCNFSNVSQTLVLSEPSYTFTMIFRNDSKNIYVENITLEYTVPETGFVYNDSKLFSVKAGNSYLCSSTEDVPLMNVTMEVYHIHIQAFGIQKNGEFSTAEECDSDYKVSDVVPIAVGCALAALIVVVLIAYLVGRRRSRQKGYQSV
ncbi:lysosome-associated membrane glycoprotein 1-like [Stegodyphus dumicola]|uniref:lysosome-associated membrane glycoprotein 1-like n=1 Tax=Stegodyphus dumicola TaxID=202533 RepID=UPI0015ABF9AF|nr:lysosome-associated membrane glycoprotein 1-like [Stegodyphus dumicola]XP_035212252.1 lysosome-associated membrane glycoprotein 1-like [Stegodyphus dumicola]